MKTGIIKALAASLILGCLLITACGEDPAEKTQGFTQSLEEEQEKAFKEGKSKAHFGQSKHNEYMATS